MHKMQPIVVGTLRPEQAGTPWRESSDLWRLGWAFSLALAMLFPGCKPLPKDEARFEKGFKSYQKGDFQSALTALQPLVATGHPASELLLAKMYANGQGVKEDQAKAEFLRNLAALKIYDKHLPPGFVQSANGTLAGMQNRLDFYAEGKVQSKTTVQDYAQLLSAVDLHALEELARQLPEDAQEGVAVATSGDLLPSEASVSSEASERLTETAIAPPVPSAVAEIVPATPRVSMATTVLPKDARGADHITLSLLRQRVDKGDGLAMALLAAAYEGGYYGLSPNAQQAAYWKEKAAGANAQTPATDTDAEDRIPYVQLTLVGVFGTGFVALGLWWRYTHRAKRRRAHASAQRPSRRR